MNLVQPRMCKQLIGDPVDHLSSRRLHKGKINATLSWQFDLTELTLMMYYILFLMEQSLQVLRLKYLGLTLGFKTDLGLTGVTANALSS